MQIQILLVSDDPDYSYGAMSQIARLGHEITVQEMEWADIDHADLSGMLSSDNDSRAAIVMLDFAFAPRGYEGVVDRVLSLKRGRRAIECMAMRPPEDDEAHRRLAQRQVFLFETTPAPRSPTEMMH